MPQARLYPPPADDTSYEADALPTKPQWLDSVGALFYAFILVFWHFFLVAALRVVFTMK